jgi:hypothetical protein
MIEEQPEPAEPVGPDPTADDRAGQRDRLAVLGLEGKQAWPVSSGVIAGEVADLEALDPDRYGVGS